MKGLRKYLTPFAPDQSVAVSVLYELGGILVICDAGGCTGNICGFDEPRWFTHKSAVFSAGLRDMDAILGRDDRLVAKLADAAEKLEASFAAIIGTPVPAVIGTDYRALERMSEKKMDLTVLTVDTDGMELYDAGEEKAYLALFQTFAKEKLPVVKGRVGVIGATPQDLSDLKEADRIRDRLQGKCGYQAVCYGMGAGLAEVKKASSAEKNLVVSPAALAAAKYLESTYGTPYEIGYPTAEDQVAKLDHSGKRILIVHQQVLANAIRNEIQAQWDHAEITVASWFALKKELKQGQDVALKEEEDYIELVRGGAWDVIYADACMQKMVPEYSGTFIDVPHFAVSGRMR